MPNAAATADVGRHGLSRSPAGIVTYKRVGAGGAGLIVQNQVAVFNAPLLGVCHASAAPTPSSPSAPSATETASGRGGARGHRRRARTPGASSTT